MTVHTFDRPIDLTESTLSLAAERLGSVMFEDMTVYCGFEHQGPVRRLAETMGFAVVFVPKEILGSRTAWAAKAGNDTFWNRGTDR